MGIESAMDIHHGPALKTTPVRRQQASHQVSSRMPPSRAGLLAGTVGPMTSARTVSPH